MTLGDMKAKKEIYLSKHATIALYQLALKYPLKKEQPAKGKSEGAAAAQ